MKLKLEAAVLAVAVAYCGSAAAQTMPGPRTLPQPGQVSVMPMIGTDVTVGGNFSKGASQTLAGAGTIVVGGKTFTFSGTATLSLSSTKFSDVYDTPIIGGISGSYGVSNLGEVFGTARYLHADGASKSLGTASASFTVNGQSFSGSTPVSAKPDDWDQFSLEAGYRQFFDLGSGFTPYVAPFIGIEHVSQVKVDLSAAGTDLGKIGFYKSSWIPAAGLNVGFTYAVAPGMAVGIESGIRYDFAPSRDNSDLSTAGGLASANDAGERWSIPFMATGRISF